MNALTTLNTSATLTMSSREIAGLLGCRHDKVKQSIERLAKREVIDLPPLGEYRDSLGRKATEYRIGKRDSYVIVAQLSPEFTAKLVDRWQELEAQAAQQAPKLPTSFAEALRLAAELEEQKEQLRLQNEAMSAATSLDAAVNICCYQE
ncbi:Phage regulatory protein Rha (Phage_pRha) [Pseudomonas sp. NFPP33]|nr:Phage regulatory protein Rha (Phage_pRha) [Pseudomonas sp. NFPP33]